MTSTGNNALDEKCCFLKKDFWKKNELPKSVLEAKTENFVIGTVSVSLACAPSINM